MVLKSLLDITKGTTAGEIREAAAAGADANERDLDGDESASFRTPLHLAHTAEQSRALLDSGADVNARDADGMTPLHLARDAEQTQTLVKAGADVDARSNDIPEQVPSSREWREWEQENAPQLVGRDAAGEDIYEHPNLPEPRSIPAEEGKVPLQLANSPEQAKVLVDAGAHIPVNLGERQQQYVAMAHADRLSAQPDVNPAAARALKNLEASSQAPEQPSMRPRRRC